MLFSSRSPRESVPVSPENCAQFETLHPRCGTSFLMFVLIISLLLFSLLGWPNLAVRIVSRLLLIPVVAGLSFELLRWAGSSTSGIVKILSVPGLLMQRITTKVPDESQLEVAIVAVKACLQDRPAEERIYDVDSKGNPVDREALKAESEAEADEAAAEGADAVTAGENAAEGPSAAASEAAVPDESAAEQPDENEYENI